MRAFSRVSRTIAGRANVAVWLNHALPWASGIAAGWATLHIVLRLTRPELAPLAVSILGLIPLALGMAWIGCRRAERFFGREDVAEIVDHLYCDDGSVTAYAEAPERMGASRAEAENIHDAAARAVASRLPRIRWTRYGRRVAPALVYCAAALLVPPRPPTPEIQARQITQQLTQPLEEKLEEYRSVLPEEDRKRLEEEIEVLKQDPKGISREQWEALEEMEKRLDTAAQRSENRMQEIASQVTEALALARQAAEESDNPDEKTKPTEGGVGQSGEQMEKALSEQLAKLAAAGDKAPSREVSEAMRDALAQMKAADAKEAAKALSALKAKLAEMPGGT